MIKVKAHATTANLGVLFDCGALAINELYTEVSIEEILNHSVISVDGKNNEHIPTNENNLCYKTINEYLKFTNTKLSGMKINISNNIPLNGGLGSSAASIVASLVSINTYMDNLLTKAQLLELAVKIESHGDNVLASLYGGFTLYSKSTHIINKVPKNLVGVLVIPDYKVSTTEARKILPKKFNAPHSINSIQNSAILTNAIVKGNFKAIKSVLENDNLIEPYRAKMNPVFTPIRKIAHDLNCLGTVISGSGSTIITFVEKKYQKTLYNNLKLTFDDLKFIEVSFTNEGASII